MFIYDGAVFVLTLYQAIRTYRLWSHSLATLMLKDGKYRVLFLPGLLTYIYTVYDRDNLFWVGRYSPQSRC